MSIKTTGHTASIPEFTPEWIVKAMETTKARRISSPSIPRLYIAVSSTRDKGTWSCTQVGGGSAKRFGRYPVMTVAEAVKALDEHINPPPSPAQKLIRRKW